MPADPPADPPSLSLHLRAGGAREELAGHRQDGGHQERGSVQELLLQLQEAPQPGQPAPATQAGASDRGGVSDSL